MALDNYDKEGQALSRMDREDKLIQAAEQVLLDYNMHGQVTLTSLARLGVIITEVKANRKKMMGGK